MLSWLGIDFSGFSKAQLSAVRFGFDALFPFVLLFLLSAFTRPVPKADLDRFFARVHTPVQPTPEEEERALRHAVEHYEEVERRKLKPGSNWEIMKPKLVDVLGFGGLLAPRRRDHLPALADGEYPLKKGDMIPVSYFFRGRPFCPGERTRPDSRSSRLTKSSLPNGRPVRSWSSNLRISSGLSF